MINPLVTIITVTYNSERTIRDTIESVLMKTYENIEYVIIDGLSDDNTMKIVYEYETLFIHRGYLFKAISEKDSGIYYAMNKGLSFATGEIIGILNSDDFYVNEYVIWNVVNRILTDGADYLFGDLLFVDSKETTKIVRKWITGIGEFKNGWNPPHPSTFITRRIYEKIGNYRTDFKISADYDLLYRIHLSQAKFTYYRGFLVKMRYGGKSTESLKSNILGNREIYISLKKYGAKFKGYIILVRLTKKIKQLLLNLDIK